MQSSDQRRSILHSFLGRSVLLNGLFAVEAVTSFLLDLVIAAAFGLGIHSDAIYAAWMVPQAIGRGIFQSLTDSFLGVFGGEQNRVSLYSQAVTLVGVGSFSFAAFLAVLSHLWLPMTIPGAESEIILAAIRLSPVLVWLIGLLALTETLRAIYYREGIWYLPSLSRVIGGLLSIGLVFIAAQRRDLNMAAWALTAGSCLEVSISLVCMRPLLDLSLRPQWLKGSQFREIGRIIAAPIAGQGFRMLAGVGERALASMLSPGSITAVVYANRIINTLERFIFRGFVISTIRADSSADQVEVYRNFRIVVFVALPISVLLAVSSRPLVAVMFGRGQFSPSDVGRLAMTLQMYAPAILGIAMTRIPYGLAFARKRSRAILGYFALVSIVFILADALLISRGLGLRAFGLGYTLAMALSFVWLTRSPTIGNRACFWGWMTSRKLLATGLLTYIGTVAVVSIADRAVTQIHWFNNWMMITIGVGSCGVFFLTAACVFHMDEIKYLIRELKELQL